MESINDKLYTTMCSEQTLQSDKNGFFLQFSDQVINVTGSEWLHEKFGKLKSDHDRIKILLTDDNAREIISAALSNFQCIYRKKDAKISRDKRQEADTMTKARILPKALMLYCQSVLRAPSKGVDVMVDAGHTLSLALWARSQVLGELGEIKAALNDLQLALKEGLPDLLRPEMYIRMAVCYNVLEEENRAKISLALAEKLYGKDREEEFEKAKRNIILKPKEKKISRKCEPELQNGANENFKYASASLELKENPELGKYFVAKTEISTGDVIAVEPPRAACLLPENFGSHCHNCFQRLVAPVGCPECVGVAFCTTECRDEAISTYHQYECKILNMLIGSGMSILCHIALRMITQDGLARSLEIFKDKSLDSAQSLCRHESQREPKDHLQRALMALFLLRCLQITKFFPEKKHNNDMILSDEEFQIVELLYFSLQMLQFNAHEIYETRHAVGNRFKTSKTGYVAVGVYPTVALLNHDCYPGVLRYFVDRKIVLRTCRPFKPGEIVAENYGPIFLMRTLAQRQRSLQSRYWFKCSCTACKEDWPLSEKLQNKHGRIRCVTTGCNHLFSQPIPETTTCPKCKQKISLKSSIEQLKYCEEQYHLGKDTLDAEEPEKATEILKEALDVYHSIASAPHKDTHLAQENLRKCYADTGNVYQSLVIH